MADLTRSHHKAVAGLGPDLQRALLGEARMQRWTVRQLKAARDRITAPKRPIIRLEGRRLRLT